MTVQITEMQSTETAIDGLLILTQKQISDERGTIREFFRASTYEKPLAGHDHWRQINITESRYGAVRGLHGEATTKLVACIAGAAFGAYLDSRVDSISYGQVVTLELLPGTQVLVPAGVCNAFQSVSDQGSHYLYCFTEEWHPAMAGLSYSPLDDGLGFDWPIPVDVADRGQISAKDASAAEFSKRFSTKFSQQNGSN
jgi:dTDP-4-dehydrorhamnose 3,5-epimerase